MKKADNVVSFLFSNRLENLQRRSIVWVYPLVLQWSDASAV